MKRRGFTLIELLVVIAIVAILAAILFPVFATAKERGRQAKCCANLKQLTMAFFSYVDDHNGFLPIGSRRFFSTQLSQANDIEWTGTQWYSWSDNNWPAIDVRKGSLFPYVRSAELYQCPTDRGLPGYRLDGSKAGGWPATTGGFGLSYSMNKHLCFKGAASPYSTIKLANAVGGRSGQVLFLIHETRGNSTHYGINDGYFSWPGDFHDKIHYNGTVCSYADGHAKWLGNEEMTRCETITGNARSPWERNSYYYYRGSGPDPATFE